MIIFSSAECLGYSAKDHPESIQRVNNSRTILGALGYQFVEPRPATEEEMLLAHTPRHIQNLKLRNIQDPETPAHPNIYKIARLSAGAAIEAAKYSVEKRENTFSLMRPPGHHAGREEIMGFCYLNNAAIAAFNTLRLPGIERVAILDIDNHYGNGTQDIVRGNNRIIHVDLHAQGDYPERPYAIEENCINFPLPQGTEENEYINKLERGLDTIETFNPNLIIVSAGFDAFKDDPVGALELEVSSYENIAKRIKELKKPICSVLEGGYNAGILPYCISNYLMPLNN